MGKPVSTQIPRWVEPIDTLQFDRHGMGAVYQVGTGRPVLIDAGVAPTANKLAAGLRGSDVHGVLVTHIHIDHIGALEAILAGHPAALAYVHKLGERHLIDPGALNASVRATVGPLTSYYGVAEPIPPHRIRVVSDGEEVDVDGSVNLLVRETPGHAPHHLCFFEPSYRILFSGDALGILRQGIHLPATAPPSFDLEKMLVSLERLRQFDPEIVCFAHFGCHDHATRLIDAYRALIVEWVELVDQCRWRTPDGDQRATTESVLEQSGYDLTDGPQRWELEMSVRGVLRYLTRRDEH
jgi:glyoxylase-like metal-dependent hydrolase (beta-lactamase superfamily II)